MEEIDDDFGDLYADVEMQVSQSMNVSSNFNRLYIEEREHEHETPKCIDSGPKNVDESILNNEAKRASIAEENGVDGSGSDSENDLNIVLNDDYDGGDDDGLSFPVARGGVNMRIGGFDEGEEEDGDFEVVAEGDGLGDGMEPSTNASNSGERGKGAKGSYQSQFSQHKYIRPHTASFPTNSKANGTLGVASYSSASVRGDSDDNKCKQHITPSSLVVQCGHNFSLPWYRTIFDVNIDTFERRPWRQPGADITEFFNFGFDEESWKHYYKCLDQLRRQTSLLTTTSFYDFMKPKEASEAPVEHEIGAEEHVPEKVACMGQHGTVSPASEIAYRELNHFEMPKGRVIQVEDNSLERQPSMDVRRTIDRDPDVVILIAVQNSMEDSSGSGKDDLIHKDGTTHEASENGDFGVDDDRVIHHFGCDSRDESGRPFLKRCSQLRTPSNPVSVDSDNLGSDQKFVMDVHCDQKVNGPGSEGNTEAIDTSNNTKEKVCSDACNAALSLGETESLLGEQTQHDQSSSYSGSRRQTFGSGASADRERFRNLRKSPNSITEPKESLTFDYYQSNDSKSLHGRRKSSDRRYYARNRSPVSQDLKHYGKRLHNVSELQSHRDYDDASPSSNTDRIYDACYSEVGCSRQDKRLHGFDSYDRENFSYYRESELSFNNCGERFSYNRVRAAFSKKPNRNCQSFGDEADQYLSRRWDGEYFVEQKISSADDVEMGSDWHGYERGLTSNPLTCKDSGRLVSNYSSYFDKERVTQWRRKGDEFRFRKRIGKGDFLHDRKYREDFMQEKYIYYDKERRYLDGKDERHLQSTTRREKRSGRIERKCDSPSIDLWALSDEDEYWRRTDHRSLSSRHYTDPHTADRGGRLDKISPRNAYNLKSTESCARPRRQISKERSRGGNWFGSHDAGDPEGSVNYFDDHIHFGNNRQPESFYWTENEYISRHEGDEYLAEEASFSFGGTSRHRKFDLKRKFIDHGEVEHQRIKLTREGFSSNCIERRSNSIHSGNYVKTIPRCRNSGDLQLVVREGKLSGRFSNAGSTKYNDKHENVEQNIPKEHIISADYNESLEEKAGQADNAKVETNQNDEKWLDKFPVTQQDEALDIEEGQIMSEVSESHVVDENFESKDVAETNYSKKKQKSFCGENAAKGNKVGEGFDNPRILEMIAKMEKRSQRFKEPITLKKEIDTIPKSEVDLKDEPTESKQQQQRPVRKRRWGGN